MNVVYLTQAQVPYHLRLGYKGRKLKAEVTLEVTIPIDAGLWDGGSRETYRAMRLEDGATVALSTTIAPGDPRRREQIFTLQPGIVAVRHSMFQGKDSGLTYYVHPDDAVKLLPAPIELSDVERAVLNFVGYRKDGRDAELRAKGISMQQRENAMMRLIDLKLVNRAGALTVAGQNARK